MNNTKTCLKSEGNFEVGEKKKHRNLEKTPKNVLVHFCVLLGGHFFLARRSRQVSTPESSLLRARPSVPLPQGNARWARPATNTAGTPALPQISGSTWTNLLPPRLLEGRGKRKEPPAERRKTKSRRLVWPEGRQVGRDSSWGNLSAPWGH